MDTGTPQEIIGKRLAKLRDEAGLNQQELADTLSSYGFHYSAAGISGWERGANYPPINNPVFADALAGSLKITTKSLYSLLGYFDRNGDVLSPAEVELLQAIRERNFDKLIKGAASLGNSS